MTVTVRRPIAAFMAFAFVCSFGCAGTTQLDRADLVDPPQADVYHVSTRDGHILDFIACHMEEDSLVGTVRHTETQMTGEGAAARTSVTNRYEEVKIPWSDVVRVEANTKHGGSAELLLAGGAIVVGAVAFLLLSGGTDTQPTTGGGGGK